MEYDILSEEPAWLKKLSNSNYRQYTLPINLEDDKI